MGRAIALAFASGRSRRRGRPTSPPKRGEETVDLIRQAGGQAEFVATDVADAASVEAHGRAAPSSRFGGLDCAVNGAAIELETDAAGRRGRRGLRPHRRREPPVDLPVHEARDPGHAGRGAAAGPIVNIASTNSFRPAAAPVGLHRDQARRAGDDPQRGDRLRRPTASGSTPSAPAPSTRRCCARRWSAAAAIRRTWRTASASWAASASRRRDRPGRALAVLGRVVVHDRPRAGRRRRLPRPLSDATGSRPAVSGDATFRLQACPTVRSGAGGACLRNHRWMRSGSAGQRPVEVDQRPDRIGDLDGRPARGPGADDVRLEVVDEDDALGYDADALGRPVVDLALRLAAALLRGVDDDVEQAESTWRSSVGRNSRTLLVSSPVR